MTIVQIGANRGYDDVTEIANQISPDRIILVEPFNEHNESLQECYKHIPECYIENIAIVDDPELKTATIHYHDQDSVGRDRFELASLNKNHFIKIRESYYTEEGMRERIVPSVTINQLLDKYQLTDIDVLFIDTEGFDDMIIKNIDFSKYNIKEIYYEILHIDANSLRAFLESKGYTIEREVGFTFKWNDKATKN
jgi:FkbM family methyltransferase